MQLWEELLLTRVKKFYVVGEKSQKCQKPGWWKTGVFVCIVSDIRNKVVKQHIAGKILAMQHMSWLLKVFHFIVERLPFSRKFFAFVWFCCVWFFSLMNQMTQGLPEQRSDRLEGLVSCLFEVKFKYWAVFWAVWIMKQVVSATSKEGESSVFSHNVTWNLQNPFFICCLALIERPFLNNCVKWGLMGWSGTLQSAGWSDLKSPVQERALSVFANILWVTY